MRRLALLPLLSLLACGDSSIRGTTVLEPSDDGLTLQGTYRRQNASSVQPTLILIHEPGAGRDRNELTSVWGILEDQGYNLLAVDLRSHGASDGGGAIEDLATDPTAYPLDLRTWVDFLAERAEIGDPVSVDRVGVVGMGLSGSLGLAALQAGLVQCVVAVSASAEAIGTLRPGFDASGDDDDSAAGDDDDSAAEPLHDTLFMTGAADSDSRADAEALHAAAEEPKDLLLVDGPHTGSIVLEDFEDARIRTAAWCWSLL